jgi:membrane associated rhomboid family serine protease
MAGADLFVVCKKCGSEVSPYITECPYCGSRLRKRAPRIEREVGVSGTGRAPRMPKMPSLGPLRSGEIPGIRGDPVGRPYATIAILLLSLFGFVVVAAIEASDLALLGLDSERWRLATSAFAYSNPWYELAVLLAIGVFGWRLELRHGHLVVLLMFVICGVGANAAAAELETTPFLLGAPGAALGLAAAWAMPDLLRWRRDSEHDGDLLGTLVLGVAVAAMPLATEEASAVATFSGLVLGTAIGLGLAATKAARR